MDLDSVAFVGVSDFTSADKRKRFNLQAGIASSALEHAVPEQMFSGLSPEGEGVSAVKAIRKAVSEGQRVYQLTSANMDVVLPALNHDSSAMSEIRAALLSGMEVTTHETAIAVPGWEGSGYIILDPDTGVGAYKISGGLNGGLHTALGYVLAVLNFFYGLLDAIASATGAMVPVLQNVSRVLSLAQLMYSMLDKGASCIKGDWGAVVWVITLFAWMGLLVTDLVGRITRNPIAAFVGGVAFDKTTDWLVNQAQGCK